MRKFMLSLSLLFFFIVSSFGKTIEERLINSGAWFLFSTKFEQNDDDTFLTQVEFFKKDDVSSLLFDRDNKLFSVFSDQKEEINEDLWKMLNDSSFVITNMTGEDIQIMEILELTKNKLVIQYCKETESEKSKCIISTYFTTKAGWLSDKEIDKLNSVGTVEIE